MFFVIGMERAGTTWAWACLNQHPQVSVTRPKEVHYFDRNFARGEAWFRSHLTHPERPLLGEVNPVYAYDPQVAERIAATYPEARLVAILRDPYQRALSRYYWSGTGPSDPAHVERSLYYRALAPYFERFPREQLRVLYYEDLVADYRSFERALYRAVGADDDFHWEGASQPQNEGREVQQKWLFRRVRRLSQAARKSYLTGPLMSWVERHTPLKRWALARFRSGGRERKSWRELFTSEDERRIREDLELLRTRLGLAVPAEWQP